MNDNRISDESIVPAKRTNNDVTKALAESVEERDSTKRNDVQSALFRTQCRVNSKSCGLHGVRAAARKDSKLKFTALLNHVDAECLREAFFNLKKRDSSFLFWIK